MTAASSDASSAVVVTGLGLHGGFGDLDSTWQALSEGRSALVPGHRIADAPDLPLGCAVPAAKIDLSGYVADRKTIKYMSDTTAMAVLPPVGTRGLPAAHAVTPQESRPEAAPPSPIVNRLLV